MEFTPEGFKKYLAELRISKQNRTVAQDLLNKRLFSQQFKESLQQMCYKYMWFEADQNREKFNKKKISQNLDIE